MCHCNDAAKKCNEDLGERRDRLLDVTVLGKESSFHLYHYLCFYEIYIASFSMALGTIKQS